MLKRQHVFIRSLLALNTIDDSPTLLSKLQTTPFEAFFSTISKHLNVLRMLLSFSCLSVNLKTVLQVGRGMHSSHV